MGLVLHRRLSHGGISDHPISPLPTFARLKVALCKVLNGIYADVRHPMTHHAEGRARAQDGEAARGHFLLLLCIFHKVGHWGHLWRLYRSAGVLRLQFASVLRRSWRTGVRQPARVGRDGVAVHVCDDSANPDDYCNHRTPVLHPRRCTARRD